MTRLTKGVLPLTINYNLTSFVYKFIFSPYSKMQNWVYMFVYGFRLVKRLYQILTILYFSDVQTLIKSPHEIFLTNEFLLTLLVLLMVNDSCRYVVLDTVLKLVKAKSTFGT